MKKDIKSRATIHRLQATGLELFYQRGYYNTSIDDILKELSLSKGAFYYHFKSKEDYFISIVQNLLFRKIYSQLIEPIEGRKDPLNKIINCFDDALETAEHNFLDYGCVLGNFITEFNGKNPEIMGYLQDILKVWEVNLVTILQKGKTDGYVNRHIECDGVANYLIASYLGIRLLMVEGNSKILRYKYIQQLRQYFRLVGDVKSEV